MSADILYDDDGNPLGTVQTADDGALILVGFNGELLGAATRDGHQLDPNDYEPADAEPYVTRDEWQAHQTQQLEAQVARLETEVAQRAQAPQYAPAPEPSLDAVAKILENQVGLIERNVGRPLSTAELSRVFDELQTQIDAGNAADIQGAAQTVGIKHVNDMSSEDRVEWMMARTNDLDDEDRGGPEPARAAYNTDSHEDRVALAMDRLEGRLSDDEAAVRTYSGDEAA